MFIVNKQREKSGIIGFSAKRLNPYIHYTGWICIHQIRKTVKLVSEISGNSTLLVPLL